MTGRRLISFAALAVALAVPSNCAAIARWDAHVKADRECRRRYCNEQGLVLRSHRLYTGHFVYWCCVDRTADHCEAAVNDCEIEL